MSAWGDRVITTHRNPLTPASTPEEIRAHREALNRKLRAVYLAGAEEDAQERLGRPLTAEEQEEALRDYPGDLPTTAEG